MKRFIIMLLIALPMATMAQTQPSELYWLYYTPDSTAYMEREFRYGGYEDTFYYNKYCTRRAHMTEEQRTKYDSSCIEFAKTLVFYTKKELERYPVKLKPGDTYNIARRNRR